MRRISAACLALLGFAAVANGSPSTYIGCLRAHGEGSFRLTEVGGPNVPESRSWRSLYMRNERMLDVAPARTLDLSAHVGHTVRMTGRLEGKTLHAASMTFVGATCK